MGWDGPWFRIFFRLPAESREEDRIRFFLLRFAGYCLFPSSGTGSLPLLLLPTNHLPTLPHFDPIKYALHFPRKHEASSM